MDESSFTGEFGIINKSEFNSPDSNPFILRGTCCVQGSALALVCAVGQNT